jgi:hypothetical protein
MKHKVHPNVSAEAKPPASVWLSLFALMLTDNRAPLVQVHLCIKLIKKSHFSSKTFDTQHPDAYIAPPKCPYSETTSTVH